MKYTYSAGAVLVLFILLFAVLFWPDATAAEPSAAAGTQELSLLTDTPEEGFALAVTLSRRGVTTTQTDREVLHALRPAYANDPDALIAASQVIAIHFQTIAAANDYWR